MRICYIYNILMHQRVKRREIQYIYVNKVDIRQVEFIITDY